MLYLSDAIRGELQTDKFNVIKAPCGSGKSYYAVNIGCCTCWVYRRFYPNIHINSNVKEYLFK